MPQHWPSQVLDKQLWSYVMEAQLPDSLTTNHKLGRFTKGRRKKHKNECLPFQPLLCHMAHNHLVMTASGYRGIIITSRDNQLRFPKWKSQEASASQRSCGKSIVCSSHLAFMKSHLHCTCTIVLPLSQGGPPDGGGGTTGNKHEGYQHRFMTVLETQE